MVEVLPTAILKGLSSRVGADLSTTSSSGTKGLFAVSPSGGAVAVCGGKCLGLCVVVEGRAEWQVVDWQHFEAQEEHDDADECSALACAAEERGGKAVTWALGTRNGWVRWYAGNGAHVAGHRAHEGCVVSVRQCGEQTLALYEGGVLVVLRRTPAISFRKYELEGQRVVNDVLGVRFEAPQDEEGSALDVDPWSLHRTRKGVTLQVLALGAFPMMGLYEPSDRQGIVSNIASAVFSLAKSWWSSGSSAPPGSPAKGPAEAHPQDLCWSMEDSAREIRTVVGPSRHGLCAVADNLGRVMLVDLQTYGVVRMWKGLRDAQCAFLGDGAFLAIYAPRRGALEVWRMRHGPREALLEVGMGLTLSPTGHLLRWATGEMQVVRYSSLLAQHLKTDMETLELLKGAVSRRETSWEPLLRKMKHPKILVKAVLALSDDGDSSQAQRAVVIALEQCGYLQEQQQQQGALMTPGQAGRLVTQDVTRLVWLASFIRAYRILEGTEAPAATPEDEGDAEVPLAEQEDKASPTATTAKSFTCRHFLRCFAVSQTGVEAQLARDMAPELLRDLSRFMFHARPVRSIASALRSARLSSSDAENLLGEYLLGESSCSPQRLESLLRSMQVRKRSLDANAPALPVLRNRLLQTVRLNEALSIARAMRWADVEAQLEALLHLPEPFRVSVNAAAQGAFSLFHLMASLSTEASSATLLADLQRQFPVHAAQTHLLAAHLCLIQCDPEGAVAKRQPLAASEDVAAVAAAEDEEDAEVDDDSVFLADALHSLQRMGPHASLRGAVALWTWQNRLQPLFWRCCALVDVAGKTPAAQTTKRALQMSLPDLRQLCSVVREWLGVIVDTWDPQQQQQPDVNVPFPSHVHPTLRTALDEWSQRRAPTLEDVRQALMVARALVALFKHRLRGVHVSCVLPADSSLRERIHPGGDGRADNLELHRHELVLRLVPVNLSLATQFAKELGMNLNRIRQNAASILTNVPE